MRFIKTIISLFSFTHLVAARLDGSDSGLTRREMAEAAHEEYLAARDEYIEKRDLFQRVSIHS
jgi:ABC-type transporter lipoprotein component MlaA